MKNKLTIETKKVLAEKVIGWKITKKGSVFYKKGEPGSAIPVSAWNPDQDTPEGLSQFVELIGKLDEVSMMNVSVHLKEKINTDFSRLPYVLDDFNWLCSNKYEVCMAIKEVVK